MKTKMLVLTAAMLILTIGSRAIAQSASELLEKAIYELGYELNNRPDWVRIPISGILHVMGSIET